MWTLPKHLAQPHYILKTLTLFFPSLATSFICRNNRNMSKNIYFSAD